MIVAVDLDDTCIIHYLITIGWGHAQKYKFNEKLLKELKTLQSQGYSLHIITKRGPDTNYIANNYDYRTTEETIREIEKGFNLKFESIIETNGQDKNSFLLSLGADIFFDDDDYNICEAARELKCGCYLVKHKDTIISSPALDMYIELGRVRVFDYE